MPTGFSQSGFLIQFHLSMIQSSVNRENFEAVLGEIVSERDSNEKTGPEGF